MDTGSFPTVETLFRIVLNTIRTLSDPNAWHYIKTKSNPADIGTRPITVEELQKSVWISGQQFLTGQELVIPTEEEDPPHKGVLMTKSVAPEWSYFSKKA